ncbi:uncharacterized protein si:dkey-191c17.2 [Megalops cyprinoides]|uniref:uncharacterized protein si:dkey-191c17.2 n=1 Tax=Megalops cyprinoides TaxID=118141 RepID=UPI001863CBEE|nr:uncharacterized protein si:dkey-191c17.2 [Megalops cyprinoides]
MDSGEEEGSQGHQEPIRVPVELRYQLGERTEARLREMGARCVQEEALTDLYYDTEGFHLATQQAWLSRQDGQWRLILDQRASVSVCSTDKTGCPEQQGETRSGVPQAESEAGGDRAVEGALESPGNTPLSTLTGSSGLPGEQKIPTQFSSPPAAQYRELTASSPIIEHLARCLQIGLPEEGETMSVERFVELAGIQLYGSWTLARKLEYRLPGTCSLVVRKDYSASPSSHTAVLTMGADVLDIGRELEKMETLAAELDLQRRQT